MNNTLGFRVIVESQYPLSLVHGAIASGLDDLGPFLSSLDEDTVALGREALAAAKTESVARMRDCAAAAWREVADSAFAFRRHQMEVEALARIRLRDVQDLFEEKVGSLCSQF